MFIYRPFFGLPHFSGATSLGFKIALGVFFILFLLGYQPTPGFPPIRKNIAKAENIQIQTINTNALPFGFILPHAGYISTRFSSYHPGIDIATGLGMPVHPVAKGIVVAEGYNFWGLGLTVTVDHGSGFRSVYAHLGRVYVKKDQQVSENDLLGEVGLTGNTSGPHTHLEITRDGKYIDPQTVLPTLTDIPKQEFLTPISAKLKEDVKKEPLNFQKAIKASL